MLSARIGRQTRHGESHTFSPHREDSSKDRAIIDGRLYRARAGTTYITQQALTSTFWWITALWPHKCLCFNTSFIQLKGETL
jgi:hypothetical protein